jgi:hypothetical protein
LFIFRARRCFCAFKGLYCLDLRLGVKDLFMHKKHSLRALNIKITIFYLKIKTRVQILKNNIKTRFIRALAHSSPTGRFLHLGLVRQINPYKTRSSIYYFYSPFQFDVSNNKEAQSFFNDFLVLVRFQQTDVVFVFVLRGQIVDTVQEHIHLKFCVRNSI